MALESAAPKYKADLLTPSSVAVMRRDANVIADEANPRAPSPPLSSMLCAGTCRKSPSRNDPRAASASVKSWVPTLSLGPYGLHNGCRDTPCRHLDSECLPEVSDVCNDAPRFLRDDRYSDLDNVFSMSEPTETSEYVDSVEILEYV